MAKTVTLTSRHALAAGGARFDRQRGIMANLSFLSAGSALGHNFCVDGQMLSQCAAAIRAHDHGVRVHLEHAATPEQDGIATLVGYATAPQVLGGQVRGDIRLGAFAKNSPQGNMWDYLFGLAEDPAAAQDVGLSVVFEPAPYDIVAGQAMGRLRDVLAVDFTDSPAANPTGLLSRGDGKMDTVLRTYLVSIGLSAAANEAQADAFLQSLSGPQRHIADALRATPAGDPPQGDPPTDNLSAGAQVLLAERKRIREIIGMCETVKAPLELAVQLVRDGATVDLAKMMVTQHLASARAPLSIRAPEGAVPGIQIQLGSDRNRDSLSAAMSDAILLKANVSLIEVDSGGRPVMEKGAPKYRAPHPRATELRGLRLVEMGRLYLNSMGIPNLDSMGAAAILHQCFSREVRTIALAQSTSDFPGILGDTMGKSLLAAYAEYRRIWPSWCSRRDADNFRSIKALNLSAVGNLTARSEGGPIIYQALSESKETYSLAEYATGIILTRRAIIDDDLGAFDRIPASQASAAARLEDVVSLSVLTANPTMATDGHALFDSTYHGNLATSSDKAAPSVTTLNVARSAMRKQRSGDAFLQLTPSIILSSTALETTVEELLTSKLRPYQGTDGMAAVDNVIAQRGMAWAVHPQLDATIDSDTDAATWYVACAPGENRGVEVAFLVDEPVPQLRTETEFDTEDVKFAVRHCVAAHAVDYRGLYKNSGN